MPASISLDPDLRSAAARGGETGDHAPVIAFNRPDLRTSPRPDRGQRGLDFIEVRQGVLPAPADIPADSANAPWATAFQSAAWLAAWQSDPHVAKETIPVTAIGYSGGQAVFVLPLAIVRRHGGRCLAWHSYPHSDYCGPIVNRAALGVFGAIDGESVLRQIAGRIGNIDLVYLTKQPEQVAGTRNPFLLPEGVAYHVGAHAINLVAGETWAEAYARRRSGKTRRRLRDKRAALEKFGDIAFRLAQGEDEARDLISLCLATKSEQLLKLGHFDTFSPPGVRETITTHFTGGITSSTWAASLDVGGRPLAVAFGFRSPETWLLYQMAMASGPEAKHSPGTHLLLHLLEHCAAQGVTRLDLGLGDETYKSEWCDEHLSLQVSSLALSARGHVLKAAVEWRARLRLRMAADPKLYERAKWIKGIARKCRLPL